MHLRARDFTAKSRDLTLRDSVMPIALTSSQPIVSMYELPPRVLSRRYHAARGTSASTNLDGAWGCTSRLIGRAFPRADSGIRSGCCWDRQTLPVFSPGTLLDLKLHEALGDLSEELAHDIVPRPPFNELGECHTNFGHRGVLSRKVTLQKQPSPKATMAALYSRRPPLSYTTPWDKIQRIAERFARICAQTAARASKVTTNATALNQRSPTVFSNLNEHIDRRIELRPHGPCTA